MRRPSPTTGLPRHPAVWWSRVKLRWPFLVWLLAAGLALRLYESGGRLAPLRGFVESVQEEIASTETARLVERRVEIGRRVAAGEVVAVLDSALVDAELDVQRLQVRRQYGASARRLEAERRAARRRHLHEQAELRSLAAELASAEELIRRRLLDARDVVPLRLRHAVLSASVGAQQAEMAAIEAELRDLQAEQLAVEAGLSERSDGTPAGTGWFDLRREQHLLRARRDGVVAGVHAEPGSVVAAGSPVVSLLVDAPARVITFLPEWDPQQIVLHQPLSISRAIGGPMLQGRVAAIAPHVALLPSRASPVAGRPVRGRRIIVELLEPGDDLVPGESVFLSARSPWWRVFRDGPRRPAAASPGESP